VEALLGHRRLGRAAVQAGGERSDRARTSPPSSPTADGSWRRATEHHENTLIDTTQLPGTLAALGMNARLTDAFGDETLPTGLRVVIGVRER